ncbi:uncharacterized protein TRAVEDRAFT_53462 [Trametes versicolor FP-101664 SS1]|uniref:uncharacterized protein n=1 Tax=Trametes versicolor (strain FP-101664) TaxID=717944 RepID=UPI0004621705|nr:uncharacterized protein TRAVEDRAFT_53462 [Trametes versicolor FP-101664 SS1]EIW53045.1 hypothetical protein TRAVEDRAFT_53462 [Trametes versicolor FP-101664 SS1]
MPQVASSTTTTVGKSPRPYQHWPYVVEHSDSHRFVEALPTERAGFNQAAVLRRLRVSELDGRLVASCKETLLRVCARSIWMLKVLVAATRAVTIEDLEVRVASKADSTLCRDTAQERVMCTLLDLFDHIRDHLQAESLHGGTANRRGILQTRSITPEGRQHCTTHLPQFASNFIITRGRDELSALEPETSHQGQWHPDAFVKVRVSSKQHPFLGEDGKPTPLLTQAALHAREHLSTRPFSLFYITLMIYGSEFCVAIFDHLGCQLSPSLDMWKNLDTFIRVVHNLTRVLTNAELGLDPSITAIDIGVPLSWQPDPDAVVFSIPPVGSDKRTWLTVDTPSRSSMSLFGDGTTVCHVREDNGRHEPVGRVMTMKSSWRSDEYRSESEVHKLIKGQHPALGKFITGADVTYNRTGRRGSRTSSPLTIHALRGGPLGRGDEPMVLHRVVLQSRGKPLWAYDTDEQLFHGLLDTLSAHKFLCDQGILHSAINAESILLAADPKEQGAIGFLTGLQDARVGFSKHTIAVERAALNQARGDDFIRSRFILAGRGDATISGAPQFMSRRLLRHLASGETLAQPPKVDDDVESFFWVLLYAVLRKLVATMTGDGPQQQRIHTIFSEIYGGPSASQILDGRAAGFSILLEHDLLNGNIFIHSTSLPLRMLLWRYIRDSSIARMLGCTRPRAAPGYVGVWAGPEAEPVSEAFSHRRLKESLEKAIVSLRNEIPVDVRAIGMNKSLLRDFTGSWGWRA